MPEALFELDALGGVPERVVRQVMGDLDAGYAWDTLDPGAWPAELVLRGRLSWTENAFNEWCTAAAMGQLLQVLVAAQAPFELVALASSFAQEELVHVHLCARVATHLGGGVPFVYDTSDLSFPLDPGLTPLQRANELVVRLCCVGEEFSLPMLAGSMKSASHPVTRAVLERIVRGEALHGRLGWMYLDWVAPALDPDERQRLAVCARETMAHLRPLWERLRTAAARPMSDAERAGGRAMGWMSPGDYVALADRTLAESVRARLHGYGIPA